MFSTFQSAMGAGHNAGFQNGLYRRTYTGNFDGVTTWFATATKTATNLIVGSIALPAPNGIPDNTSHQFLGWFKAPYTETFTFTLTSDDKSNFWIGDSAKAGNFGGAAPLIQANVTTVSNTIALTKGVFYALRLQIGNDHGAGTIYLAVSSPSLVSTQDLTHLSYFNPNTQGI